MNVVRTESLTKIFGSAERQVVALDHVTFSVAEGEFVAIMGPSGSGKSTLLYLMGGLDTPTSGSIWLEDQELSTLNDKALSRLRRQRIGFVFQFFNLIPVLTARENVAMPLILDGVPRAEALRQADDALGRIGLEARTTHRPSELSGGQQQRVTLARSLVTEPALMLSDEPTGNLDSKTSDEVINLLRQVVDDFGRTLVIVTHDPRVAAYADRIVFLKDGQIVDENILKGGNTSEDQVRSMFGRVSVTG
ncbi:MAG: ABC transporter ATP-binding protein [Chloroflexi bacterium]|nr:ABC transporter ATP-binding protein [Chloroflexota bacterium]